MPSYSAFGEHLKWIICVFVAFSQEYLIVCYGVMDRDCGTAFQTLGRCSYLILLNYCYLTITLVALDFYGAIVDEAARE